MTSQRECLYSIASHQIPLRVHFKYNFSLLPRRRRVIAVVSFKCAFSMLKWQYIHAETKSIILLRNFCTSRGVVAQPPRHSRNFPQRFAILAKFQRTCDDNHREPLFFFFNTWCNSPILVCFTRTQDCTIYLSLRPFSLFIQMRLKSLYCYVFFFLHTNCYLLICILNNSTFSFFCCCHSAICQQTIFPIFFFFLKTSSVVGLFIEIFWEKNAIINH